MQPLKGNRLTLFIILGFIIAYLVIYVPTPYYIIQPGSAEEIKPMVTIQEGPTEEKGTFMLTTVRMSYSNTLMFILAQFNKNAEILKKSDLLQEGESQAEYSERQDYVMLNSQSNAMISAYEKAGIAYDITNKGVLVLQTLEDFPAAAILEPGDQIMKLDGKEVELREEVLTYIKTKKIGDTLKVTYKREGLERTAEIKLEALPPDELPADSAEPLPQRAGLGIVPVDLQNVEAKEEEKQIEITAGDIGGPSAGLMFALEIYNQLVAQDITKGYRIAGTGTINTEGQVGVIGGIKYKVVAADKAGADIFFAPKDFIPEDNKYLPIKNTTEAMNQAKKIKTKMIVVSVDTLEDALRYLETLPPKS